MTESDIDHHLVQAKDVTNVTEGEVIHETREGTILVRDAPERILGKGVTRELNLLVMTEEGGTAAQGVLIGMVRRLALTWLSTVRSNARWRNWSA